MYILTIYTLPNDLDIEWQQADTDEAVLKRAAIVWFNRCYDWENDADGDLDSVFDELVAHLEGGEADDRRIALRRADA